MTGLSGIEAAAAAEGLAVMGGMHPGPGDGAPGDTGTLVLLGPDAARWEAVFAASPEAGDGAPHPIDRWSRRVVGRLAGRLGGQALYPFDGPPWLPVIRWALATGRAWSSPVGMLVHDRAGLWFACRGVLALPARLDLPATGPKPCESCPDRPCLSACPVDAFASGAYDVPGCVAHVSGDGRDTCLARGCAVRHACPAGAAFRPLPIQASRHMHAFLRGNSSAAAPKDVDKVVDNSESS